MINKPYKIIHQYKNDYQRIQYLLYIYLGSLIPEGVMVILKKIEKLDLLSSFDKLTKKEINLLEEEFGEFWYESFFINDHIIKIMSQISKDKSLISKMSSKFGDEWVKNNILKYKLVRKNLIFNHQAKYQQNLIDTKNISLSLKKELDFRTNIAEKQINEMFSLNNQIGGEDDNDEINETFELESIEDFSDIDIEKEKMVDSEIEESDIGESEEDIEEELDLDKMSLEIEETDTKTSTTADLISQALNEKSWKKETSDKIEFNNNINKLTYDMEIENVYEKIYILNSQIYPDDNIKTLKEKITYTIPLDKSYMESNHILPSRQYLYAKYYFKNKEEQIMIGQKWSRRNELLNIDIIPNQNLQIYENLRGNLKYLRDSFGVKIKREEEEDFILRDYSDFITNNEIYLIDIYSQLGHNYKTVPDKQRNLFDVFISIYFPFITSKNLDDIINLLNKKDNGEEIFVEQRYKSIRNDLKLESEITELVNDTLRDKREELDKMFEDNHIIQSIIHVNMFNKNNITGTTLDDKFNLYAIFDSFIVNEDYPFVQYNSLDNGLIYKFYQNSSVVNYPEIMKKWFENAPYGISVRQKISDEKYISFTLNESGKIEYRITWREEDKATIVDVKETYDLVRQLLKKINKENNKVKFINPEDERFTFAFVNSIQKFNLPEKLKINHNDLSDFSRFFYPYISLVIEPRKREGKIKKEVETSKFGTYLRYKRVSKFENRIRMHLRILYIMRNFEFSDKDLINEVARQFNITLEIAAKELDFVRDKYANVLKKSRKVLKKLNTLPKSKPPGVSIDIIGRSADNYKIRITGARNKEQLFEIIDFIKVLMFLYTETYLYKKSKYQKIKETLKKLTNIAKRRNLVAEIVDYSNEIKNVKVVTSLDKKRLGFRPDEGQNQWTRSCQNSGDDKKRRPVVVSSNNIQELIKQGFKYDEKTRMYLKKHKDKDTKKEILVRAIPLSSDEGNINYYYCDPDVNKEHKYIGFLTKGNNPDNLCMPCCFKKDQYNSTNKFKSNYFKKCIGEVKDYKVEKKALDNLGDKLYILQETNKVQEGRFLFLSKYLEYFFNKIWNNDITIRNHYMIESISGYYLKFMVKDNKFHFLAAISAIYNLSFDEIINKIVEFFEKKENLKYFYFLDEGLIFQKFNDIETYLEFIKEKKFLDYKIIGEVLTLPGVLEKDGLGIFIFNKQINIKLNSSEGKMEKISYYLDCLNSNNQKYLFSYKTNIFLIKENKYYFPIFMAQKEKSDKKINIYKKFIFENKNNNMVNQIRALYISSCSEKILTQLSISSKYQSKYLIEILDKLIPIKQYLDSTGKVNYLELKNLIIPVYPSGMDYNLNFTFEQPKFKKLEETIKNLKEIEKIDETFKPYKLLYNQKIKDKFDVHGILLHNKLVLPIIYKKLTEKEINKTKLQTELRPLENIINQEISTGNNPIDNKKLNVKKNQYLEEGYNLYRFELSYFLSKNIKIKNEIIDILNSEINENQKRELLRPFLISISNPKLKKFLNKGNIKNQTYFIMSLDKKKDLKNFKINNQRNYCLINKNKETCDGQPFCSFVKGQCYFSLEDEVLIEYINRLLEELIQKSIGYKEIIQEDNYFVSDIVNNKDFTNRENQKILKVNNLSINKIINELFGNNMIPNIGKRKNQNLKLLEEEQPKLEKIGDYFSQEIIPNQNSNIRAYVNSYYWLKNPLYKIDRRNLGYQSFIQNELTSLLKAKIIDFVLQYEGTYPKILEKIFITKNNINGKLMEFAKSNINTDGNLEFFVLSKLYEIPIVIYNKFNEIVTIFDDGKIIQDNKLFNNYSNNIIKIKQDITSDLKVPRRIFSLY